MTKTLSCPDCGEPCRNVAQVGSDFFVCLNPECLMMGFDKKKITIVHWSSLVNKSS